MFENILSSIKNQTLMVAQNLKASASLNDLRPPREKQSQNKNSETNKSTINLGIEKISPKGKIRVAQDSESDSECVLWQSEKFPQDLVGEENEDETLVEKFSRISSANGNHLHRRNDREEIRRRLAMGIDAEEDLERLHGRKQSLQSRLQSNMNLQICFMNETASDGSDSEAPNKDPVTVKSEPASNAERALSGNETLTAKDSFCSLPALSTFKSGGTAIQDLDSETDFFTKQAKLQMEARTALAQAKELARVQMQVERQQRKRSLVSDFVRQNLEKTGLPFAWDLRRLSRQVVNELSVAQLQVIVNDLHTQIEGLNEELVQQLMQRDDFHMEQDSMLVDIEDLTRYLTAKQQSLLMDAPDSGHLSMPAAKSNPSSPSPKQRLRSLRLPILRK